MCTGGDAVPGGYAEALAMLVSSLDYLRTTAAAGELADPALGEVLAGLQEAQARHAAARSAVLDRFDAADRHDADGYQNSSSWLRDKTGMTPAAARRQVRQMRTLRGRPRLADAVSRARLSESWLEKITDWTRPLPPDMLDRVDELIVTVLEAGGDLDDVLVVITAALESEHAQPDPESDPDPDDPDDGGFDDRSVRLETTLGGAGSLRGDLTPEAAAALRAVLESLGKKQGKEDTRTQPQRDHDALLEACRRLLGSRMLPARAGSDTRAEVRIPFSELVHTPGAETLTEAWLRARAGEPGWLLGPAAEAAVCDALVVPMVTASPEWPVITEMIYLVADTLGDHGAQAPPLPPEAWQRLVYALGRLAIKFVSGPGAIASVLRTGLAPAPFNSRSVPLDVGYSDRVPEPIRRAVIARAGGRCEWPGGCDRPAAASDVHHIQHKKDGGPTSVVGCFLGCQFHHDIVIHRWGWTIAPQADGTFTATSPDGTQVIRARPRRHPSPPAQRPPPDQAA